MKAGWQTKRLGDVCLIQPPKSEARRNLNGSDLVSFVPMESLGIGQKHFDASKARALEEVVGSYTYFADGDVLLAKITPCFENGKLGIARNLKNSVGFGSSEYIVFRSAEALLNQYLYYFLSRETFREEGAKRMMGAVGHKRVAKEFIENTLIPFPPLPEQQRIVAILDEAFAGIATATANAEKNRDHARELFQSTLQSVFTQQGEGWVERRLEDLCDIKHGFAFDGSDFATSADDGKPIVITPGNFTENGALSFTDKNTKRFTGSPPADFIFNRGDLVVVMTDLSSKMKILGRPALIGRDGVLHNQRIGRVVFNDNSLYVKFLYYFFITQNYLDNIKRSATGTMVKHTAPKRILSNRLPYPSKVSEQQRIVAKLDELSAETQHLEAIYQQKLTALTELKKSILHQAFSGQLH